MKNIIISITASFYFILCAHSQVTVKSITDKAPEYPSIEILLGNIDPRIENGLEKKMEYINRLNKSISEIDSSISNIKESINGKKSTVWEAIREAWGIYAGEIYEKTYRRPIENLQASLKNCTNKEKADSIKRQIIEKTADYWQEALPGWINVIIYELNDLQKLVSEAEILDKNTALDLARTYVKHYHDFFEFESTLARINRINKP